MEALAFEGYGAMVITKDHGIGWLPLTALKALKKDSIRLRSVQCQLPEDANPPWSRLGRLCPPAAKGCPALKIRLRMEWEGQGCKGASMHNLDMHSRALLGKEWDPGT